MEGREHEHETYAPQMPWIAHRSETRRRSEQTHAVYDNDDRQLKDPPAHYRHSAGCVYFMLRESHFQSHCSRIKRSTKKRGWYVER